MKEEKEEKKMFSIYANEDDFNFLKAYTKAWGKSLNSYLGDILSDRVKELQSDMLEKETRLNIIKEELKKNLTNND